MLTADEIRTSPSTRPPVRTTGDTSEVVSVIKVSPRARRHEDRAGDPLDGLVNLFDLGIVLAVAFLLAALSSLHVLDQLAQHGLRAPDTITVNPGDKVKQVPPNAQRVVGRGKQVGQVYRLDDGRLIYVVPKK